MALARPFFSTETFAGVMPTRSTSSPTDILRLASITSRFTRIAMSDHHLQLVVLDDGGQQ